VIAVRVLFFAALRELAGASEQRVVVPAGTSIGGLRVHLESEVPTLRGRLGTVRFACNEQFVEDSIRVEEDDVVALIPPVGGGA
jgi:molybdopterin converting factor subunit 1